MADQDWRQRIVCDPDLHHGEPCIRGTRIAVSVIVASIGDIRIYRPGTHAGILLSRPDRESVSEFRALVSHVLARHKLESLAESTTVASPRSIRVRRAV